jgi:hypothetical protein
MISGRRIRRLLAPTAGLSKSVAVFLGGVFIFLIGSALSYKLLIVPALDALATMSSGAR